MSFNLAHIIVSFIAVLVSLTFHEFAHAAMANALGDPTAKNLGRMSTNPLVHIDPVGTILFPLVLAILGLGVFGWAKPVPYNPANLKSVRKDSALIAAAGPLANLVLAIIASVVLRVFITVTTNPGKPAEFIFGVLYLLIIINIYLMLFNLLPITPLDGSGILQGILSPSTWFKYRQMSQKFMFIFLAIILLTDWFFTFYLKPVSGIFLYFLQFIAGVPLV